jgi:hypothetical protein
MDRSCLVKRTDFVEAELASNLAWRSLWPLGDPQCLNVATLLPRLICVRSVA